MGKRDATSGCVFRERKTLNKAGAIFTDLLINGQSDSGGCSHCQIRTDGVSSIDNFLCMLIIF